MSSGFSSVNRSVSFSSRSGSKPMFSSVFNFQRCRCDVARDLLILGVV